jgi:hypothetical protein
MPQVLLDRARFAAEVAARGDGVFDVISVIRGTQSARAAYSDIGIDRAGSIPQRQ